MAWYILDFKKPYKQQIKWRNTEQTCQLIAPLLPTYELSSCLFNDSHTWRLLWGGAPFCCKLKFNGELKILAEMNCPMIKITLSIPVDLMELICSCHLSCTYCTPYCGFQYIRHRVTFHYILDSSFLRTLSSSCPCILYVYPFTYLNAHLSKIILLFK